jgi:hypothetical protein
MDEPHKIPGRGLFAKPPGKPALKPTRKPSAKPAGNPSGRTRAHRHGFYAPDFSAHEIKALDTGVKGGLTDEEHLMRVLITRLLSAMQEGDESAVKQGLLAMRALCMAVTRIESLNRSRNTLATGTLNAEQLLAELKRIPFDVD